MSRRISPHRQALTDQIVAVLRGADGFPLSTGDVAKALGDRLVTFSWNRPPRPLPRPQCWPDDVIDDGNRSNTWCVRCRRGHQQPVWRTYGAEDVRSLLNRLARDGEVEKVVLDGQRQHYWRRDDSDCEMPS